MYKRAPMNRDIPDDVAPGYAEPLDGIGYGLPRRDAFEHNKTLLDPRKRVRRFRAAERSHPNAAGAVAINTAMLTEADPTVTVGEGQSEEAAAALRLYHGIGDEADDEPLCGLTWQQLVYHGCARPVLVEGMAPVAIGLRTDEDSGLHIPYLAPSRASNVYRYYDDGDGELMGVELRPDHHTGKGGVFMPRFDNQGRVRMLWFSWNGGTNLGLGEGFDGNPVIRSVLADIEDSINLREYQKVAAQRHAVPNVHVQVPYDRLLDIMFGSDLQSTPKDEKERYINQVVQDNRKGFGYIASTADAVTVTDSEVKAEILGAGNLFDPSRYIDSIAALDRGIGEAFMAGWIQQGRAGSGGARSMVNSQIDAMRRARDAYLSWFIRELRRQLHGLFYDLNFPGMPSSERPTMGFARDMTPAFLEHAEAAVAFIDRGMPFPEDAQRKVGTALGWEIAESDTASASDVRAMQAGGSLRTPEGQRAARAGGR